MIELKLTAGDLAQLHFCISPLSELMGSLAVLQCRSEHPQHRGWVTATQARIRHLDRELLLALVPPSPRRASLPLGDLNPPAPPSGSNCSWWLTARRS
jgi:hypothetical protein